MDNNRATNIIQPLGTNHFCLRKDDLISQIKSAEVVQRFFSVLNLATTVFESGSVQLNEISLENFENNVSRILSSEYSNITPLSWAEKRKYAQGHTQYPELFCSLMKRIGIGTTKFLSQKDHFTVKLTKTKPDLIAY